MFQKLSEAYATLADPARRKKYDESLGFNVTTAKKFDAYKKQSKIFDGGDTSVDPSSPDHLQDLHRRFHRTAEGPAAVRLKNVGESSPLEEIFGKVTKSIKAESIWSKVTKSFARPQKEAAKEAAPEEAIEARRELHFAIDALESIVGTTREAAIEDGTSPRLIRVKIPPGICDGSLLKINCPAKDDSEPATLFARVSIRAHEFVEREQQDMIVSVPITLGEALSGVELYVPTVAGPTRVQLPANWDLTKKIRIRGKGPRYAATNTTGDAYIRFFIVPPDQRSPGLNEALVTVEDHYSTNPRSVLPVFKKPGETS